MVLAASGSKSAAGASMRSAQQSNSNTKANTTNPRGPTGPSNSQPRSSPAGGGSPGAVSRGNYGTNSSSWSGGSGGGGGGNNRSAASPRSGVQGSVSPTSGNSRGSTPVSTTPNAAAAKASQALNAGLGRPSVPSRGLGTYTTNLGVAGAALGSFRTATAPVVRNYLANTTAIGSPMKQSDAVLRAAGITNPAARAGILGTFDHESGGFNPAAVGDNGSAYGLGQWRGDRQQALRTYASGLGMSVNDPRVQTGFAATEMAQSYPKTLNALKNATTIRQSVEAMNAYERPRGFVVGGPAEKVAGWNDRLARSERALTGLDSTVTPPVQSASAAEEMVRRAWVNNQIGQLYADPAINIQLPNALGRGMWDLRVSDATRLAQGKEPLGAFGERQLAPWPGAGFRTAEQAADNKRRQTGVGIDRTFHGVGLAADITVPRLPGETTRQWENRNALANAALNKAIDPSTGVTWGGTWSRPDLSHFQLGQGSNRSAAIEKYGSNVQTAGIRPDGKVADTKTFTASMGGESLIDRIFRDERSPKTDMERTSVQQQLPPQVPTSVSGGLGVQAYASTAPSNRLGVNPNSTTTQRDAFYGGTASPSDTRQPATYSGYGTFNGPTIVTTPDPRADDPNYAGWRQTVVPAEPARVYDYPRKPYGTKTKTLINAPLGLVPIVGDINTGLGLAGYSVGDYIVNEQNKLANMTPEQRDRYRAYWAEKRANAPGRGPENRGSRDLAMRSDPPPVQSKEPTQTSRPSKPASSTWEDDAKAYGYTDAQLKDPETRDLIKQLWEMGFIPKSNPST